MSAQSENVYTLQAIALNQLFWKAAKPNIPRFLPTLLWVEAFLEPLAGILYVISAIPAIRKEGVWFFKAETNGMIRPNTCILIPIFVLVYIICSLSSLICLLIDLDSTSIISARTVFLSLISYPTLLCTGWTKIWNVLRAIPLTKYGLATMRQTNGDSSVKLFKPRTINLLSIFFYGFPLIFGSVPIGMITREVSNISQTFIAYNHSYSNILSGQLDDESIADLNTIAVQQLVHMDQHSDKVILLARVIARGYLFNGLLLQAVMSFGYYRLLKAVGYQIDTFHNALEQPTPVRLGVESTKSCSSKPESTPGSIDANSTSPLASIRTQQHRRWTDIQLPNWLPSLRPDPDFLGKPTLAASINNTHRRTSDSQRWESLNQATIYSQYQSLKRYKVNLVWQAFCNALILLSFLGLNVTVFGNLLQVPLRHSLSDLIWFTITWASWSWVLTVGLPFGMVACVVAFSPPITALRENEERVEGFDD